MSDWPHGTGEMAARIRAHDWASTPVGSIEHWTQTLRIAVGMVLAMPNPATIIWGPQQIQIYNDAYIDIAKGRHPALLGCPVAEGWPDAYDTVIAPLMESFRAGSASRLVSFPVKLEGPDGRLEERVFDTDWSPIRDETGAVAGALQTLVEATERLVVQKAMRESEARHRLLIGSWAQAVWETDADGVVVADSPSWRAYTGQTQEEWIGYGWLNAIHPDDRAYVEKQWREAIEVRGLVNAEFRLRAPNGGWRWTNVRAVPVVDATGRVEKWAGMNIDIDARRRAEAALRESEERFRGLIEGFGQFSWEASAEGLIEVDSPGWRAFTGQRLDEWLGRGWINALHPDDQELTEAKWQQALADRTAVDHEYRLWHAPTALWRWSNVRAVPITNSDGSIRKWSGVNIDVTDHHKLLARQKVLINELQHRSRNLIGVVTALSNRTIGRGSPVESFTTRLKALSRAQALLSQSGSDTVAVEALVRAELAAHADGASGRITVVGPAVLLTSQQVQNVALALHELTTNAVKYGALKEEAGRLAVTWEVIQAAENEHLALDWIETGVNLQPETITHRGYGRELIERALAYALGGRTDYTLASGGVRCRIELPLS